MIQMEGVKPEQAKAAAIRADMQKPDPYERPDYKPDDVRAEPDRLLRLWRYEAAIRSCWRV